MRRPTCPAPSGSSPAGTNTRLAALLPEPASPSASAPPGVPNTDFMVDRYRSSSASPSGFGEAELYVGSFQVHTQAGSGDAAFSRSLAVPGDVSGQYFTATASRVYGPASFETSEFSRA